MAARKKKAAKKVVKKKAAKKTAARKIVDRRQPESLRLRQVAISYTVSDVHKSLAWYTDVLGLTVQERWEDKGTLLGAELRAGSVSLMIGQDDFKKGRDRVKGVGVRIYCRTAQDIDQIAHRIKSKGGALDHDPQDEPWGERDFGITDPDGYKITVSTMRR